MIESILKAAKFAVAKGYAEAAATSVTDATIIDLQSGRSVCFIAALGPNTASGAVTTLKAKVGDKSDLSDGEVLTVMATHTADSATSDDDKLLILDVVQPGKRYVQPVLDRATAAAELCTLIAVTYNARCLPTSQGDTVLDAQLSVN